MVSLKHPGLGLILGLEGQRSMVTWLKSGSERPSVPVASPRFFDIRQMARPSSVNPVNIAVHQSSVITQLVMSVWAFKSEWSIISGCEYLTVCPYAMCRCCDAIVLTVGTPDVECEDGSMMAPLSASFVVSPGLFHASLATRHRINIVCCPFSALTLLVGRQEGHPVCKKLGVT